MPFTFGARRGKGYWVYPGNTEAREYFHTRPEAMSHAAELRELKRKNPNAFPPGPIRVVKAR